MKDPLLYLFLILFASSCESNVQNLQKMVEEEVKKQLGDLESMVVNIMEQELVGRYGMIRRCSKPEVDHGTVSCNKDDLVPGTRCSAKCSPGYSPTHHEVRCQQGGKTWSGQLRCDQDKSLLVVSGGSDSASVEVINFHNSTGCELNIPDIPKTKHGEVRLMHNMFYFPFPKFLLLVCNGLSQSSEATCDSWSLGDSKWKKGHSFPNGHDSIFKNTGRYAAGSYSWDGYHYNVGGMLNKGNDHHPTNTIRYHSDAHWDRKLWEGEYSMKLKLKRTLFCVAQLNISSFFAIGGYSGKLEKSVELVEWSGDKPGSIPDMETARNGYSCVGINEHINYTCTYIYNYHFLMPSFLNMGYLSCL